MANEYKLSYTAEEINNKLGQVSQLSEEIADLAVTPQMYGAVGDGVTDDTQALKTALAENSAVFLPKGTYLITEPIDLTQGKSLYSYNQEGVIKYTGSESVILLGRRSRISGVKIQVGNANVTSVFNTDNRIFQSTSGGLMTEVNDIEVYFTTTCVNTTLINVVASNKDYLGVSGFHNQSYSDIRVAGNDKIKYGIKVCVSFDNPYDGSANNILPWITNMRFNHIWLGSPKCAIKIYRENNSGTDIAYNTIVKTEHMMFTDIAAQCTTDGHVERFYDVEWCMAEFINCQPWDYHHVTTNNGKYNVIGAGARLSEVNARRSPIDVAEFPSVTTVTPEQDPVYFLNTFFNFQSNIDGKYDYVDMKVSKGIANVGIDEVKVENIAQKVVEDNLSGVYYNIMTDEETQVLVSQRFSNSGQSWNAESENDVLVIPIKQGTNLIRWQGNELTSNFMSVFFHNDLSSGVLVGESDKLVVTSGDDRYLLLNNTGGYKYVSIPFWHTEVTMNANNMIVTINQRITESPLSYLSKHINDVNIHVTAEDKENWNNKADKSSAETWKFTLADGSTVTKKVVLA